MDDIYNITFLNGVNFDRLTKNLTLYISDVELDLSDVRGPQTQVFVTNNAVTQELTNVRFVKKPSGEDGEFWYAFEETPEVNWEIENMKANIEYLAMMADVEL